MKHSADRIAKRLEQADPTATLHSNRSQNQRLKALKDFKSGEVRVLVATDIAARGIDVDGISHVVNFDFPMHAEDYVHRIGRTGRAQAIGDAISFVTPEDRDALRSLERFIGRGMVRKRADDFDYHAVPLLPGTKRESSIDGAQIAPSRESQRANAEPEIPAAIAGTVADVSGGDNNALVELSNFYIPVPRHLHNSRQVGVHGTTFYARGGEKRPRFASSGRRSLSPN